jgi:hypothetical protein
MKNVLIVGDSFSCIHKSDSDNIGWPELLKQDYKITNLSQAGVSEYKIYKQLKSIDVNKFDHIIVCHTSFTRIPIEKHPYYGDSDLHKDCDLIFTDVEDKKEKNEKLKVAYEFFKEFFWEEYFIFSNKLIFEEIYKKTKNKTHITFFDFNDKRVLNLKNIFDDYRGDINHLNKQGNIIIYNQIKNRLWTEEYEEQNQKEQELVEVD